MPDGTQHMDYASPACSMHDLSPVPASWPEVRGWRKAERERLIGERLALSQADRHARSAMIARQLDRLIPQVVGKIVGTYWPFRGEPDLRNWGIEVVERGGRIALPVVIQKGWPLEYRVWTPGDPLERGVWNILVPARGPAVQPDIVIAPLVGFDARNYRLGYGGGFFDRTLAAMPRRARAIGVGYAECRLPTIHPQPHDVPMDAIVAL